LVLVICKDLLPSIEPRDLVVEPEAERELLEKVSAFGSILVDVARGTKKSIRMIKKGHHPR
jgi:hypothetical protein